MLAEERFAAILKILSGEQAATVSQLAEKLGVSESTVRRDLAALHKQNRLRKVHGGATLLRAEFMAEEPDVATKETRNVAEKDRIATYAAKQVQAGDFVFLDAGTTTYKMIEYLPETDVTYVTNGVGHAARLSRRGFKVYVPGGLLRPKTEAFVGAGAMEDLRRYHFTKAFMGVNGISLHEGFTTPDTEEAALKSLAIEQAYMSYVLADHTKFNKVYAASIAPLEAACVITDYLEDQSYRQALIFKEVDSL